MERKRRVKSKFDCFDGQEYEADKRKRLNE